jgi:hypothetical protein
MSDDIVLELRAAIRDGWRTTLLSDAAIEIERLRAEYVELTEQIHLMTLTPDEAEEWLAVLPYRHVPQDERDV